MMLFVVHSKKTGGPLLMIPILSVLEKRTCLSIWAQSDMFFFAAEQGEQRIAIEIKSFLGPSLVTNLHEALGQFVLYEDVMELAEPERILFLAVSEEKYAQVFEEDFGRLLLDKKQIRLLVFDPISEIILKWID
jgi:hypothetical protein